MIPVAIYARYSTDKQDARSIEDQLRRCREFAEKHGYDVVAEFSDAATSGAHTERANLRRMLDVATATKRPPFKAVIVDDLSRLSRDLGDTWRIIFTDLASVDVKVIDASTGMSSDASGARTMFAAMAMVNDTFLQLVRHETHRGLQGRAIAGFSTGGSLYGYRTVAEPNPSDPEHPRKLWVIDETEAPIVRRIFAMLEQGSSYRAIADRLNREGIPAPRNNGRGGKFGAGWTHMTVRAILTNEKYIGRFIWNTHKWTRVPGKRARRRLARPESEHVVREMPELAIIDRVTWGNMQAKMTKRGRGDERTTRKGQQTYLVSGLLRCGVCGGPLSVRSAKVKKGVRYVNFGCTAHSSRGGSICPNGATISEKQVNDALIEALRDTFAAPETQEVFARAFEKRVGDRGAPGSKAELQRQLDAAQRRVANATRLLVEMPDDLDIRRQRQSDQNEIRRFEAELAEAAKAGPQIVPDRKLLAAGAADLLETIATGAPERAREALARCMTPLSVTPKKEGPSRFHVAGTIDLAQVAASGSSGGTPGSLIYRISKVKSRTRTLQRGSRG